MAHNTRKRCTAAAVLACVITMPGFADPASPPIQTAPPDLLAPVNRAVFGFNLAIVDHLIEPTAVFLGQVVPGWLQKTASNVYENISEPEYMFTNLVDGHPKEAAVSVGRMAVNTTVGQGGIFDPATAIGLVRRPVELSESMCRAGIRPSPYVVLPMVGPTNLFSGGIMIALLDTEWYLLHLVDTMIAAGDALLDTTVAAASMRHVRKIPSGQGDLYTRQQDQYWNELGQECPAGW
jgi:phospholipid-binding lipoprotein MlaA